MDQEKLIEEDGLRISIQKIALKINEKMKEYEETKDNNVRLELIELIKDRDLVYSNDKKTINKYIKNEE